MSKAGTEYHFTSFDDGFRIDAKDRRSVEARLVGRLHGDLWQVTDLGAPLYDSLFGDDPIPFDDTPEMVSLYNYSGLTHMLARILMKDWRPPSDRPLAKWDVEGWAKNQVAKTIGRRVRGEWGRQLDKVDPTVRAVHRAIFAVCGRAGSVPAGLFNDPYLVADVLNYRAAASAVVEVEKFRDRMRWFQWQKTPEVQAYITAAKDFGLTRDEIITSLSKRYREIDPKLDRLEVLRNWRGLYSPSGKPYRSLNRTLMNLPGNVPPDLLTALTGVELERPITERLELMALLIYAQITGPEYRNFLYDHTHHDKTRIFMHARRPQLREAMRRVSADIWHDPDRLTARKVAHVRTVVQYLADYPDPHAGNVVGLADKAVAWHRAQREANTAKMVEELGHDTPAKLPPVDLPTVEGIRFLGTVADIVEEGAKMDHCVASYAREATRGGCYLFHVEKWGEAATVQVGAYGEMIQANGPRNRTNRAAKWGARTLGRWGQQITELAIEDIPF